jgi:hypothetical protein
VVGFLAKEIMFAQTRTPPEQMPLPKGGVCRRHNSCALPDPGDCRGEHGYADAGQKATHSSRLRGQLKQYGGPNAAVLEQMPLGLNRRDSHSQPLVNERVCPP